MPHEVRDSHLLPPARGFSHAVIAAPGRTVYLGGQTAHGPDGRLDGNTMVEQFDRAAANVVTALKAAGARPEDLVSLQIYVTDAEEYRSSLEPIGEAWRQRFGKRYPAMALLEVAGLFDPDAKVELVGIAVIPTMREDER
ncbi:MAG: RidA family protein [Actinobacteria bacterium]|nr:RidA family protein [Actinomycetota bacterium]